MKISSFFLKTLIIPTVLFSFTIPCMAADESLPSENLEDIEEALAEVEDTQELNVNFALPEEGLIAAVENLGPAAAGFPADTDFGPQDDELIDPKVLRDFIESRGLIRARKNDGCLTIAGDVRARWLAQSEQVRGIKQRGSGTDTALNTCRSEVNLFFDYVAPKSWLATKLKWSLFEGTDGGSQPRVDVDRAFLGYDIYCKGDLDFYIEAGRSRLDYIFDSKVEFSSLFDGIHIYFTDTYKGIGQFLVHGGPYVIDSFTNDFAWAIEAGLLRVANTGFSVKYSFVHWPKRGTTQYYGNLPNDSIKIVPDNQKNNPRYRFLVSQVLLGYECKPSFLWKKTLNLYAAALINHDARPVFSTGFRKLNNAWYAGVTLGRLCKACDWSIDFNYQSVQAQAVPEFDLGGVGRGNAANTLLSDAIIVGLDPQFAQGFTNYRGFQITGLFALTESLSLKTCFVRTKPCNKSVGGDFRYQSFELGAVYAF